MPLNCLPESSKPWVISCPITWDGREEQEKFHVAKEQEVKWETEPKRKQE